MKVTLGIRTEETVRIYFDRTNNDAIRNVLPQKAKSVTEAVEDYKRTLLPETTSYGKTILADDVYVGDIWCYCMDAKATPNAMISYCIFDNHYWNRGIATEAMRLFLEEIESYCYSTVGAFTFSDNIASIRVLEKHKFKLMEEMEEENILSRYYERKNR